MDIKNSLTEYFSKNDTEDVNQFVSWTAHKAFIRGLLIKKSALLKRKRRQYMETILNDISSLESQNKKTLSASTSNKLAKAQNDLRALLVLQHTGNAHKLRASFYTHGNKAGKLLVNQIKDKTFKQRIPHLYHPKLGSKLLNPKEIADAFSSYYGSLYNLKDDKETPQPTPELIEQFLHDISLPTLQPTDHFKLSILYFRNTGHYLQVY